MADRPPPKKIKPVTPGWCGHPDCPTCNPVPKIPPDVPFGALATPLDSRSYPRPTRTTENEE